jgi:hypothetical protein
MCDDNSEKKLTGLETEPPKRIQRNDIPKLTALSAETAMTPMILDKSDIAHDGNR